MSYLDHVPWAAALLLALTLGLAPFTPEPHLVEKLRMLATGTLHRPLDIFDLWFHGTPWLVVLAKLARLRATKT